MLTITIRVLILRVLRCLSGRLVLSPQRGRNTAILRPALLREVRVREVTNPTDEGSTIVSLGSKSHATPAPAWPVWIPISMEEQLAHWDFVTGPKGY